MVTPRSLGSCFELPVRKSLMGEDVRDASGDQVHVGLLFFLFFRSLEQEVMRLELDGRLSKLLVHLMAWE
jgi:hypothetical protein